MLLSKISPLNEACTGKMDFLLCVRMDARVRLGISLPVQLVCDSAAMATRKAVTAKMSVIRLADIIVLLFNPFCLSISLFCLFLSKWLSINLPICWSIYSPSAPRSIFLFISFCIDPSSPVARSIFLLIYLSIYLSVSYSGCLHFFLPLKGTAQKRRRGGTHIEEREKDKRLLLEKNIVEYAQLSSSPTLCFSVISVRHKLKMSKPATDEY